MLSRRSLLALAPLALVQAASSSAQSPAPPRVLPCKGAVYSVAFSQKGDLLLTAGSDGVVRLWSIESGALERELASEKDYVYAAISPSGDRIAAGGRDRFEIWSRSDGKRLRTAPSAMIFSVAFSATGDLVACGEGKSAVASASLCIRSKDGEVVRRLGVDAGRVYGVAFSPKADLVAGACGDGVARVWSVSSGALTRSFSTGKERFVRGVAFSPDAELLAVGCGDGPVRVWSLGEGSLVRTFEGHAYDAVSVAFSPAGDRIVSGSVDETVKVWSREGKLLRTFEGHKGKVFAVAWSPRGDLIASGSTDGNARLWPAP